jgi:hypothetical protein
LRRVEPRERQRVDVGIVLGHVRERVMCEVLRPPQVTRTADQIERVGGQRVDVPAFRVAAMVCIMHDHEPDASPAHAEEDGGRGDFGDGRRGDDHVQVGGDDGDCDDRGLRPQPSVRLADEPLVGEHRLDTVSEQRSEVALAAESHPARRRGCGHSLLLSLAGRRRSARQDPVGCLDTCGRRAIADYAPTVGGAAHHRVGPARTSPPPRQLPAGAEEAGVRVYAFDPVRRRLKTP